MFGRWKWRRWWQQVRVLSLTVYEELFRTRAFNMAAAMSYYFLFALIPLLIFLSAMLGYLPIHNLFGQLLGILGLLVPPDAMQMVQRILANIVSTRRSGLLSFGLLSYLWTASGGFAASIDGLNVAYDVKQVRSWWRDRLQALLLTFTTGLLGLLAQVLLIAGPKFGHFVTSFFPVPHIFAEIWPPIRMATIFISVVLAIEVQYYLAPNRKQRFRDTQVGAVVAVAGIFLSSAGMTYYFDHFANYNKTYGSMGAVAIWMLWFYVVALLVLVGAELNAELLKQLEGRKMGAPAQPISAGQTAKDPAA
jgi:membrane protein